MYEQYTDKQIVEMLAPKLNDEGKIKFIDGVDTADPNDSPYIVEKINELVEAVNQLKEKVDEMAQS